MSSLEIVTPIIENEIEFYVSADGKKRGISQIGTARLCGVPERTMRRILASFSDRQNQVPKDLEHLRGVNLYLGITSGQQAKVLDSKVVASLVSYYAFQKDMAIAKYSLQKFASIGIDTWIDKVTGCLNSNDSLALLKNINEQMGKLHLDIVDLKKIEEETAGYRRATVKLPILEKWMHELTEETKQKVLAPSEEMFTMKEAIATLFPGTVVSPNHYKKLALKVSQTINSLSGQSTPTKLTPNSKGYSMAVKCYTREQFPLIKLCYVGIISE